MFNVYVGVNITDVLTLEHSYYTISSTLYLHIPTQRGRLNNNYFFSVSRSPLVIFIIESQMFSI